MPETLPALFDSPPLPGLAWHGEMISHEEEAALITGIDSMGLSPFRFQGWTGKRLTVSLGWRYDFDSGSFGETVPIPDWLFPVRATAAAFAGLESEALVQALLIRYDPGAGIGWHRDRPVFGHVIGISLGNEAVLRLRRRRTDGGFQRVALPLPPRSIYHLSGEARYAWEHSITPMAVPRWSITFRSLASPAASAPSPG